MSTTKENATGQISIRFTPQELEEIKEFAAKQGFEKKKFSEWVRQVINEAVHRDDADRKETDSPATRPRTLAQQLADEETADLIYQLVADKLRLSDLRAELAAFALQKPAATLSELDGRLRSTAARIAALPQDSLDEDASIIAYGEIEAILDWKAKWTYAEFIGLKDDVRIMKYPVCMMTIMDGSSEVPYYFWSSDKDWRENCLKDLEEHGFDGENDSVYIYGAELSVADWCRKQNPVDLRNRVVHMMRYVARDNNIGLYDQLLNDRPNLRYFTVRNEGMIPPGIPWRFAFGWTSDARNAGKVYYKTEKEAADAAWRHEDDTFRPVANCRWHYTGEEAAELDDGTKMPFDADAVPEEMRRYLAG